MAETSKIQWTHATFNPWRGCARVSEGCRHCYAETLSKRNPKTLGVWGVDGTRVVASDAYWREPLKWAKQARLAGERRRVFCASLADVGEDRPDLVAPRARLCELIRQTADVLDWLLLTKRPENLTRLFPDDVLRLSWVGTTVENVDALRRADILKDIPARVRFLSCEPLLEDLGALILDGIDWIIVGGESGGQARPFAIAWARSILRECRTADVPCFIKQFGSKPQGLVEYIGTPFDGDGCGDTMVEPIMLADRKGGDWSEWPEALRVREFPVVGVEGAKAAVWRRRAEEAEARIANALA